MATILRPVLVEECNLPIFLGKFHDMTKRSNKILGEVRAVLEGKFQRNYIVDYWPDLSAVVSLPKPQDSDDNPGTNYLNNVVGYHSVHAEALKRLLSSVEHIDWGKTLIFSGFEEYASIVRAVANEKGGKIAADCEVSYFVEVKLHDIPDFNIPEGYILGNLHTSHAPEVSKSWEYSTKDAEGYVHWLIKDFSSVALYDTSNQLVAYMIETNYGSMGMLYVHPQHRKKGLAKVVLTELAKKLIKKEQPAFAYIVKDNEVSLKLHEKCGFKTFHTVTWLRYAPANSCSSCDKKCCV